MSTKQLVRIATSGSVDDGKSTLLGRLLFETQSVYEDQLADIKKISLKSGKKSIDYSLLLDGLSAEREQGITIDVAYRYFETEKRKFIVADTPGHEQYTRNMITGASTADIAIVLIDAKKGVSTQSKRHIFLLSLLNVSHVIIAINKLDLVDYSENIFLTIVEEFSEFCKQLNIANISFIPISALNGDNITERSQKTPWYQGETLLYFLEQTQVNSSQNLIDFRFPVQMVIRPDQNFRGYAGSIASGKIRAGEQIIALPSMQKTTVKSISTFDEELETGTAGDSVVITFEDEIDVSRGDMICRVGNIPTQSRHLNVYLCWMSQDPSKNTHFYWLKQGTKTVKVYLTHLHYQININNLHRKKDVEQLELNEIGRVEITTTEDLFFDPYQTNKNTGSFILIDPSNNQTVAAGMIRGKVNSLNTLKPTETAISSNVVWQKLPVQASEHQVKNGHKPAILWLTGLSGSGKSSLAQQLVRYLFDNQHQVVLLDGDNVRHGLCGDLGFSLEDRTENIRRIGEVAKLFYEQGNIVVCTFISPLQKDRDMVQGLVEESGFHEIFIQCALEECIRRDTKGLYKKALSGEIKDFTGISSPYEAPTDPAVLIETTEVSMETSMDILLEYLKFHHILRNQ